VPSQALGRLDARTRDPRGDAARHEDRAPEQGRNPRPRADR
jgi:hypothetical protein